MIKGITAERGSKFTMKFRIWLQNKWYEHLDELMSLGLQQPDYDVKHYFNKYKYWLKREYRQQKETNK